jgi:two-component system cell cycle response regulator DivK
MVNCALRSSFRQNVYFRLTISVTVKDKVMDTKKGFPVNSSSQAEEENNQIPSANFSSSTGEKETSDLPKETVERQEAVENTSLSGDRPKVLVLVVDDIVDNVALLSLDLQQEGYRVVTASNGEEAVKVALLMRPNIILMDISMPLLDGLGAATKIREDESLRTVPIIATTAFSTSGFRRAAYDVGFDGYLTKPIDFDQLHELINRLLANPRPD